MTINFTAISKTSEGMGSGGGGASMPSVEVPALEAGVAGRGLMPICSDTRHPRGLS